MENIIKAYKNNKVAHVYTLKDKVFMDIYDSMKMFVENATIRYNDTLGCYTAKINGNGNAVKTYMVGDKAEFLKAAKAYGRKYHHHCYRAIYAEVAAAKVLEGRHNTPNTPHGRGDVVTKYARYEVKFGSEVTL